MQELRQLVPREVCLKCDVCCRFSSQASEWSPVLSEEESANLRDKKINGLIITENRQFELFPANNEFVCPCFSPKDNRCKIYDSRPHQCQLYPFLLSRNHEKIILAMDLKCPFIYKGVETGRVKKDLSFSRYVQYLINLFNSKSSIDFISKNPQLVGSYSEEIIILATLERLSYAVFKKIVAPVNPPEATR